MPGYPSSFGGGSGGGGGGGYKPGSVCKCARCNCTKPATTSDGFCDACSQGLCRRPLRPCSCERCHCRQRVAKQDSTLCSECKRGGCTGKLKAGRNRTDRTQANCRCQNCYCTATARLQPGNICPDCRQGRCMPAAPQLLDSAYGPPFDMTPRRNVMAPLHTREGAIRAASPEPDRLACASAAIAFAGTWSTILCGYADSAKVAFMPATRI